MEKTGTKNKTVMSDRIVDFVLAKKNSDLASLTESYIASELDIDLSKMRHLFLQEQEISLEHFLLREKLHRAFFLLEESKTVSLQEVSQALGFEKTEQLNRQFREYLFIHPERFQHLQHHR